MQPTAGNGQTLCAGVCISYSFSLSVTRVVAGSALPASTALINWQRIAVYDDFGYRQRSYLKMRRRGMERPSITDCQWQPNTLTHTPPNYIYCSSAGTLVNKSPGVSISTLKPPVTVCTSCSVDAPFLAAL